MSKQAYFQKLGPLCCRMCYFAIIFIGSMRLKIREHWKKLKMSIQQKKNEDGAEKKNEKGASMKKIAREQEANGVNVKVSGSTDPP